MKDILSKAVASNKQMPQVPLTIQPNTAIPNPPKCPEVSGNSAIIPAANSAFSIQQSTGIATGSVSGNAGMTSVKLSRQIGEKTVDNSCEESNTLIDTETVISEVNGTLVSNAKEDSGVRRSK